MIVQRVIPILLTTTTPTLFRIVVTTFTTVKTTKHDSDSERKRTIRWIMIHLLQYNVIYILPCFWLLYDNIQNERNGCPISTSVIQEQRIDSATFDPFRYNAIYTAILWHPMTTFLSKWPYLFAFYRIKSNQQKPIQHQAATTTTNCKFAKILQQQQQLLLRSLMHGGPFGTGCYKIIQLMVALVLWKRTRGYVPLPITNTYMILFQQQHQQPTFWLMYNIVGTIVFLSLISWIVDRVLQIWFHYSTCNSNTRGNSKSGQTSHTGVNQMVQSTVGRNLYCLEHFQYAGLAILNAVCEECVSRGFIRSELEIMACCTIYESNILQGIIFGIWHYYGIPNGWSGVVLTSIYGWMMGYLSNWSIRLYPNLIMNNDASGTVSGNTTTGLLLPIITHSIADYYIFTVIARQHPKKHSSPVETSVKDD